MKKKILFVCEHNSARSQMAEAFCNHYGGEDYTAESAGIKAGGLNPYVVEVMKEIGIDISQNKSDNVFDFFKQGRSYSYVITVCDQTTAEKCPIFPGLVVNGRLHWSFPNPSDFTGTEEEKLAKTRQVRDEIKKQILAFLKSE